MVPLTLPATHQTSCRHSRLDPEGVDRHPHPVRAGIRLVRQLAEDPIVTVIDVDHAHGQIGRVGHLVHQAGKDVNILPAPVHVPDTDRLVVSRQTFGDLTTDLGEIGGFGHLGLLPNRPLFEAICTLHHRWGSVNPGPLEGFAGSDPRGPSGAGHPNAYDLMRLLTALAQVDQFSMVNATGFPSDCSVKTVDMMCCIPGLTSIVTNMKL